jgi:hypothetical protein
VDRAADPWSGPDARFGPRERSTLPKRPTLYAAMSLN